MKILMMILVVTLIAVLVLTVLYLLSIMPRMTNRPDMTPFSGWLYAHRGLHDNRADAPENSMAAFQKAVEAGYGIELDVQLTRDQVPVVFHDFTLKRVCGLDKKVCELTWEELQDLRLCGSDQKIPSFAQVLKLVKGRVPLIVEYKIERFDTKVCELADALLSRYPGVYCIESFNPLGVLWYKKHRSEIFRGILSDNYVRNGDRQFPWIFYEVLHHMMFNFIVKPDFIAYNCKHYRDTARSICRSLFKAPSVAWTIKSQKELEERKRDFDLFIFDSFVPAKPLARRTAES